MHKLLLPFSLLLAFVPALAFASGDAATARSEQLIAAFKKVQGPTDETAFAALDDFLDFDTLTSKPIESRADKFTPPQRKEFQAKFRQLIRLVSYPNSGEFFRKADVKLSAPRAKDGITVVSFLARMEEQDFESQIGLHWKEVGGKLKLVDISFDGDSLVLDYRNQFTRIIDKEGVEGLLARADERIAALKQGKKD